MIEDAIRTLIWSLAKLFLSMSDWMYEALQTVIGINLTGDIVRYTWLFMLLFLSFACFVRIGFILLNQMADDEQERIDYSKLGKRIVWVFCTIALSLTFFNFSLGLPKTVTDIYNNVISYDERLVPSSAVISSTAKTSISSSLGDMKATDEVISIDMIDEKLNTEEDGEYIYFFGFAELFLCIAGAFVVMCVQLNIVIDVILRLFLNVFRFVIGFIPISSLVEDNSTCGDWIKDIISDTVVMSTSLIFTNMIFGFMTTNAITSLNGIIRIIVFTVGLIAVSRVSEAIAKYMGASNLTTGGRMGTMLLGFGAFGALRGAGKVMKGAVKYGASGVSHGADYVSSKFGGSDNAVSNGASDGNTPLSPLSGGGLGASISNDVNDKNDYFVRNGTNGIDVGSDTSFNASMNQSIDDSILDSTPTSINMSNEQRNTNSYVDESKNSSFISDDDMLISNQQQNSIDKNSSNSVITSNNSNSAIDNDGLIRNQGNISNKGNMEHNNYEPFKNDMVRNKGYGFMRSDKFSMAGLGFVDNPTSGHLFKESSAIYKQSIRERLHTPSIDSRVNNVIEKGTKSSENEELKWY